MRTDKLRRHFSKIIHRGAVNGDFAECSRLQNIVSAAGNKRPAHKNCVGKAIDTRKFSHRVEQKYATEGSQGFTRRAVERYFASPYQVVVRFRDNPGRFVKAVRLARRENEQRTWKLALDFRKCPQDLDFFIGHDAPGN